MEFCTNHKEALDKETIKKKISQGIDVHFKLPNKDLLVIRRSNDVQFLMTDPVDLIEIIYGVYDDDESDDDKKYNLISGGEYWPVDRLETAVDIFMDRMWSDEPQRWSGKGFKPCEILVYQTRKVYFSNHYDYLNRMLEPFWKEVFGKTPSEMWCGGIVSAHGDKCRGYNRDWEEKGINSNRGSLLFLLTYTKEFGENEKHTSDQWVIDNYQKYLPMIEKAEAYVLEHIFDKDLEDINC
jgi:hypothetical protein